MSTLKKKKKNEKKKLVLYELKSRMNYIFLGLCLFFFWTFENETSNFSEAEVSTGQPAQLCEITTICT